MGTMAFQITSLNRLFKRSSKKASKLCVTGLCAGNSPVTGEFPAQMASSAENVSIWRRHHDNLVSKALMFDPEGQIDDKPGMAHGKTLRRTGDKLLSEPMMIHFIHA